MRIPRRRIDKLDPEKEPYQLNQFIADVVRALQTIKFGNGLSGGNENIDCDFATIADFGIAGTEATASHNLRRVPVGVWLIKQDRGGSIYQTTTATSASIYLKCDTANLSGTVVII